MKNIKPEDVVIKFCKLNKEDGKFVPHYKNAVEALSYIDYAEILVNDSVVAYSLVTIVDFSEPGNKPILGFRFPNILHDNENHFMLRPYDILKLYDLGIIDDDVLGVRFVFHDTTTHNKLDKYNMSFTINTIIDGKPYTLIDNGEFVESDNPVLVLRASTRAQLFATETDAKTWYLKHRGHNIVVNADNGIVQNATLTNHIIGQVIYKKNY